MLNVNNPTDNNPHNSRKKIMMLICVLISAPLGTWMALKYLGIL